MTRCLANPSVRGVIGHAGSRLPLSLTNLVWANLVLDRSGRLTKGPECTHAGDVAVDSRTISRVSTRTFLVSGRRPDIKSISISPANLPQT